MNFLRKIDSYLEKFASSVLVVSVFLMMFMTVLAIILRWFSVAFLWLEPLVRHLVFLSAFMGGVLATGKKTHIGIDILGKYLESKGNQAAMAWVERLTSVAAIGTLVWLTKASIDFVAVEAQYGKAVFLGIHSKVLVSIIPFGMGLMSLRFLFQFIWTFCPEEKGE